MADSPLGPLVLVADGDGRLCGLLFADRLPAALALGPADPGPFREVRAQLDAYFAGVRRSFDLPLAAVGTPFQRSVWAALAGLPYGTTVSYGALAVTLGRPGAGRAVGLANGANPISVIVPCHRVIGADGALTGYGGGVERKRFLLELEGVGAAQLRLLDGPGYRRSDGAGSPPPTAVGPATTGTVLRSAWSASPDGTADASGGVR